MLIFIICEYGFFFFLFIGNYQKALDTYKDIHRKFPENVECEFTFCNFEAIGSNSLLPCV